MHRALGFALAPLVKKIFRGTFTTAAQLCENDAKTPEGQDLKQAHEND